MDNNTQLIYIEPSTDDISNYKKIIKKQGVLACQDKLDVSIISTSINNFTFGFISLIQKAQLGRRSINSFIDKYTLKGFILCNYNTDLNDELTIELVCSSKGTNIGKLLIEVVQEKAKQLNIKKLLLLCLANNKLRKWYEMLGFIYINTIYLSPNVPKVYRMVKFIIL